MSQFDLGLVNTLLAKGVINQEQVDKARELMDKTPQLRMSQALVELGYAHWEEITRILGDLMGYEVVDLREARIPAEAIDAVPARFAKDHSIVPLEVDHTTVTVAVIDPYDLYVLDKLRFMLNKDVRCKMAAPDAIEESIEKFYGVEESTVDNMLQEFTESDVLTDITASESGALGGVIEEDDDAPMIRLVQLIISEAVKTRTSDIHIEPMANRLRIRYRVDGKCQEMDSPPKRLQGAIISRIKIMSEIDIAEKRRPTDGRISVRIQGTPLDIRVSCLPASHGESVVMRLLRKESILINLTELGFHETDNRRFLSIIKRPNGIFLVTGPTGSGKTTTLYAALSELNRPDKKIITAENPVEYSLSGINQCEVKERIGLTFAMILRSMLRQAPNIILVGEIRDHETAEIAVAAALTGHLVFSTLHTNDAPSAITRLIDMGVKPFLVASSIQAIMAQRLVRRICEQCKVPYEPPKKVLAAVRLKEEDIRNVTFYTGEGCSYCKDSGFRGRMAIFELMEMDATLREMAFRRESHQDLRKQARISGMSTLEMDGVRKALAGQTMLEEVIAITQREAEAKEEAWSTSD